MRILLSLALVLSMLAEATTQSVESEIESIHAEIQSCQESIAANQDKLERFKLKKIIQDLTAVGFPSDNVIVHSGMVLSYSEKHEQAKWVMHMILPDIKDGSVFRTNDFRVDPKVATGTAVQEDYFLTDTLASGKIKYDGFGYDRGHLAPSADFRWSKTALSESYFYSNMSPQVADFNREKWADLEDYLRKYVLSNEVPLYVVTAPILTDDLPKIDRSVNGVSIPSSYVKFAYDPVNKRSIAFLLDNKLEELPLDQYAKTVDEVEAAAGIDVFTAIEASENSLELSDWFEELQTGDVEPIAQETMPERTFNSVLGMKRIGKKSKVCGTVVSVRMSRSGNLWMNLDKQFPNQIFSIYVRKNDLANFDYDAKTYLVDKEVCFEGKVEDLNGTATINIKRGKEVKLYNK